MSSRSYATRYRTNEALPPTAFTKTQSAWFGYSADGSSASTDDVNSPLSALDELVPMQRTTALQSAP